MWNRFDPGPPPGPARGDSPVGTFRRELSGKAVVPASPRAATPPTSPPTRHFRAIWIPLEGASLPPEASPLPWPLLHASSTDRLYLVEDHPARRSGRCTDGWRERQGRIIALAAAFTQRGAIVTTVSRELYERFRPAQTTDSGDLDLVRVHERHSRAGSNREAGMATWRQWLGHIVATCLGRRPRAGGQTGAGSRPGPAPESSTERGKAAPGTTGGGEESAGGRPPSHSGSLITPV